MAVIEIEIDELRRLVGRELSKDEFIDDLFELGVEFEYEEDGTLGFEVVPDRPDRLSVEGLARSLRYDYGIDKGVYVPETTEGDLTVRVDDSVSEVRPYVTAAVVRDVDLSGGVLDSIIQLQEKLHSTVGRRRNKGAIGVHDLSMIKGNEILYKGVDPDDESFVPLDIGEDDSEEKNLREMTPKEVMEDHPVGREYASILEGHDRVPAIYDSIGLFSFPPVINGQRTRVTERTRDLLIELTGTYEWTVDKMLNILLYALDARGGQIEEVEVVYENQPRRLKPDLSTKTKSVTHDRIESVLGTEFSEDEVVEYLERSGMEATPRDDGYDVRIPPYRTDIKHPLDVIDDIGRAYGFNSMEPRYPDVSTVGELSDSTRMENAVRKQLVGLGFQDLLNFVLTSPESNYDGMRTSEGDDEVGFEDGIRIENPYSEDYSMMRTWLLPSVIEVLSNNTHREYPQNLSEIGTVAEKDGTGETGVRETKHVSAVVCGTEAGYEAAKARLNSLVDDFGSDLETPATHHPSFIDGRSASVIIDGDDVGVIGEIHPEILAENEITMPVAGFEFELDALR
ncbi:phenylalanine--tRNA ligase subunit beta [Halorutilales archaeon Cl-col2-1]